MNTHGIVDKALSSLGKGFDITSDFRLKYCKGKGRLILLNKNETKELVVPGFGSFKDVSVDIKCDKGDRTRYQSDILDFNQMSEFFNKNCAVPGKIPSGLFNSTFGFDSGSWAIDAANTKNLGIDGYFIVVFNFHLDRYPLVLSNQVQNDIPSSWDPCALASFIEKYGTHIIVGLSIGGQDIVVVKQDRSSSLEPRQLKSHLDELGDQLFTGLCTFSPKARDQKPKLPEPFKLFDPQPISYSSLSAMSTKNGITVINSKRGGDTSVSSHCEWLLTVPSMADAIHFSFIPITSLLKDVPGKGFLSHAINLYMRYKPPIGDLKYFLDFQGHKVWAPMHNDLPLAPTPFKSIPTPALQFNYMSPKLYVNTAQVTVGQRPVSGMRLFLEGMKCNRLAIHLQHLSNTPALLRNKIQNFPNWRGSEELSDERYFEPIQWKKFSHVCTCSVKYDPKWAHPLTRAAFIVTGAQLHVQKHGPINVLHLRLSFAKVSNAYVLQSSWSQNSTQIFQKSSLFSMMSTSLSGNNAERQRNQAAVVDSSVYPGGPPVPVQAQKLLKFVDLTELSRGPLDSPGHWLVTGAMLVLEKGKIGLNVKFSLLHILDDN